ncbi:MAG: HAD-IC family P-type ATPase, partial [Bacilli bacterium]
MIKINRHLYIGILSILFVASIIFNKFYAGEVYSIIAMLLLTVLAGLHIFKKALIDLKYLIFGIDLLVMIAVIGAIIIGDYFEAAAVTYLFTLGHYLEKGSLEKTRSAIADLIDLKPVMARKIVYDVEVIIPAEEVVVGDILLVKPGEKIPADGSIIEGYSSIDEQMMTGESLPVDKKNGDLVYSGTIISSGYIKMKALKIGDDTTFSKIIEMVEEAQDKKAKTQKFIEKFAKYYTPSIIVFSIAIYLITFDIRMAITMLVISCPGALVIST